MNELVALFALGLDPLELVVRGTAIYWFLFLLFRFVLRRDGGAMGIADVLLVVLIADASQNAMAGTYQTITDGVILVSTIAGWNHLLDWASFRFPAVRRFVEPAPLALVRNGRLMRSNMRRELVTVEELQSKLREHGLERFDQVKLALMESGGEISVLRKEA
ncbi:YetF domain-containing protein [Methylibium sp.]|uniref:DUF421 domain-containing protein n=1 Tax=Methylibium sp. TaxID=2067992 RepID=UPI00286D08DF|nr:YetF domain-containing protein [Methylibium sp.]